VKSALLRQRFLEVKIIKVKIIMIAPEAVTLMEFPEAEPVVTGAKPNGE
jgi:hypothetical protein